MYCHLVTVKVSVISSANQRMQLDSLTFDQNWLECLNTKSMQSRRTVQQYWMFTNNVRQDIPDFCRFLFHHFLGGFDCRGDAAQNQSTQDEWLEQFQCHLF